MLLQSHNAGDREEQEAARSRSMRRQAARNPARPRKRPRDQEGGMQLRKRLRPAAFDSEEDDLSTGESAEDGEVCP